MIPLRLQLKNFLSYGSQQNIVNFEPYDLICLSGKNGHGKSALLDALTWVLWGQARKTSGPGKADEGLVRLGQNNMAVSLDFKVRESVYRVRREYAINQSKATTYLDFGIVDEVTSQFRPLTEKTIRVTQEKIEKCVGLDYESFINSAFLRQGQSNEFSKKSARERKEILANILGLNRYEQLRKRATEKSQILIQEKAAFSKRCQQIVAELKDKDEVCASLEESQKKRADIVSREEKVVALLELSKKQKKELEEQKLEHQHLSLLIDNARKNIKDSVDLLGEHLKNWRGVRRRKRESCDVGDLMSERVRFEERLRSLQVHVERYRQELAAYKVHEQALREKKETLLESYALARQERAIKMSRQEAHVAHITLQKATLLKNYEQQKADLDAYAQEIRIMTERLNLLAREADALDELEKNFERRKVFYHKWVASGNELKKELRAIADKRSLINLTAACCPLCKQQLSDEMCNEICTLFGREEHAGERRLERMTRLIQELKNILVSQNAMILNLKKKREECERLRISLCDFQDRYIRQDALIKTSVQALTVLDSEYASANALCEQLKKELVEYESPENYIARDVVYQDMIREMRRYEAAHEKHAADEKEYHDILKRLSELSQMQQSHQELLAEIASQDKRKQTIHELCLAVKKIKPELSSLVQKRELLGDFLAKIDLAERQERSFENELKELQLEKESILQKTGALEHHKSLLDQKEKEAENFIVRLNELTTLIDEYRALAQAFGKDGIQALLIEEAIPDIEKEANNLLSKLTDNQAHLMIESLRDLKSGATKETLDIKISDTLGIRPYELFSGGEAFRIDFALRIAISKLLAKRAGATLQLLIIDEGFGSQDEEGLAHIMDTLYKIRDDFAKIIVVSHLPGMKDQFPVQFVVDKTSQGSVVTVAEQG